MKRVSCSQIPIRALQHLELRGPADTETDQQSVAIQALFKH
jgi:hypothetical protein